MEPILVDTDVISFAMKGDSRAALYKKHVEAKTICISFMTCAELYRWAVKYKWSDRRIQDMRELLFRYVVLEHDDELSWEWARVMSIRGLPIAPGDAWTAAMARRHKLPLLTHNRKHFDRIPELTVISES